MFVFCKGTNTIALLMFQSKYVLVFYHSMARYHLCLVSVPLLSGKFSITVW